MMVCRNTGLWKDWGCRSKLAERLLRKENTSENSIQNLKGCCSIVDIHNDYYMHRPSKETLVTTKSKILYFFQIIFIRVHLFSRKLSMA